MKFYNILRLRILRLCKSFEIRQFKSSFILQEFLMDLVSQDFIPFYYNFTMIYCNLQSNLYRVVAIQQ